MPTFTRPTRPVDLIRQQQRNDRQITTLQYPIDIPKYYMMMDIQSYSRQDLFTIAQTTSISNIVLPLPAKLVDTQQTLYEKGKFSAPGVGHLVNQAAPSVRTAVDQADSFSGAKDAAKGLAGNLFSANTVSAAGGALVAQGLAGAPDNVDTAVRAFSGYSPNYFLTVLLDGPQYKTHNLQWQFSARTAKEADTLSRIIRVMNNAQAPGTKFGGAVFSFPRVFRIAYFPNSQYLYKFKPAVLINFTVDFSGGGLPAFYRPDTATNNLDAPIMLTMQATFLELEFWLRSDFGGDPKTGEGGNELNDPKSTVGTSRES